MLDAKQDASRNPSTSSRKGALRRLVRSESGNVLALTAAATLPMLAVIGGAVDMSRIYLTKSRVQAACDSAVLAGRKAMSTAVYTDAAKTRARSMFNVNFQDVDYGTTGTSFVTSADAAGKVSGTATTTLPMVVMGMFGAEPYDLTVNCSADIQVPNIDIVLVLDVTGSMDQSIGGKKKIDSLKIAAKDFFDTLTTAMAGNTTSQIRYGFVPYSEAVNGLDVFKVSPNATKGELPLSHFADSMVVQSRVANFNTKVEDNWVPDPASTPTTYQQTFHKGTQDTKNPFKASTASSSLLSTFDCDQYASNKSFSIDGGSDSGTKAYLYPLTSYPDSEEVGNSVLFQPEGTEATSVAQTSEPTTGNYYTKITFERVAWSGENSTYKACTRRVTKTRYIKQTGYKFTNWSYKPVTYNVSQFKSGSAINYVNSIDTNFTVPENKAYDLVTLAGMGMSSTSTSWTGCIEERDTTAVSNFAPIPTAAYDLNYIDGGTSNTLRWRPILRDLNYDRERAANRENTTSNYDKPSFACPTARMRSLNVMTKTEFYNYIDTLQPNGNTYLDIGMIWGLRLISPQGLFASRNLTGPNGGQISRHIIFLTDGEPVSATDRYTAYGVERMDQRITGSTGVGQAELHRRRFQALCDAQRGAISIWAIALGTSVTTNMAGCADPGRAYQANNTTELQNAFKSIAKEVADLRLVQ